MTSKISFNCPAGRKIHYALPSDRAALSHHGAFITSYQKQPRSGDIYIFVFTNVFIALSNVLAPSQAPSQMKMQIRTQMKMKNYREKNRFSSPQI